MSDDDKTLPPMVAKLGEHNEVIVCSFEEWHPWAMTHLFRRHPPGRAGRTLDVVVERTYCGPACISTVFVGMNASPEHPTWFETRVFGGEHDGEQHRYATWDEAKAGHDDVVERLHQLMRSNDHEP